MRQAIETRYAGPTNFRGSRVIARCEAGRITDSWDHAGNVEANHRRVAMVLAAKLGWQPGPHWVGGGCADGRGYVFVDSRDGQP
jgi:hypothetical protein